MATPASPPSSPKPWARRAISKKEIATSEIELEMSRVGTRGYAPKEIIGTAPTGTLKGNSVKIMLDQAPLIDSYGLGRLLRYMLTGAPPHQSIMEAIEAQSGMCVCFPRSGPRADDGARLPASVKV